MFETVLTIDNERMAEQKAALLDYVLNVKEFYRQEIAQIDRVLDKVNLMNPEVDVREFVQKGQFFQPLYSNEDRTPIFQVRSIAKHLKGHVFPLINVLLLDPKTVPNSIEKLHPFVILIRC